MRVVLFGHRSLFFFRKEACAVPVSFLKGKTCAARLSFYEEESGGISVSFQKRKTSAVSFILQGGEGMIASSAQQTADFAAQYAKTLRPGDVVLLRGEMGAGKTVFVQGAARGLGGQEQVTSPTYAYMNEYPCAGVTLYHFDCYRLSCGAQAEALGLTDYFYAGGICFIEWAENIADVLPTGCKVVEIVKRGENEREIVCR